MISFGGLARWAKMTSQGQANNTGIASDQKVNKSEEITYLSINSESNCLSKHNPPIEIIKSGPRWERSW